MIFRDSGLTIVEDELKSSSKLDSLELVEKIAASIKTTLTTPFYETLLETAQEYKRFNSSLILSKKIEILLSAQQGKRGLA